MRSNIAFDVVYTHTEGEPTVHHTFGHFLPAAIEHFGKTSFPRGEL
jgi:hypothetical protein